MYHAWPVVAMHYRGSEKKRAQRGSRKAEVVTPAHAIRHLCAGSVAASTSLCCLQQLQPPFLRRSDSSPSVARPPCVPECRLQEARKWALIRISAALIRLTESFLADLDVDHEPLYPSAYHEEER